MRAMGRVSCVLSGLLLSVTASAGRAGAESLADYARACKAAVGGVDVEAFDCTKGFPIPMQGDEGGKCAKPPYLPTATCRTGSRLGVQATGNPKIAIVWLCRKKGITDPDSAIFDDVAVIQTNFENGATCFYQRIQKSGIDGSLVPAPRDNVGNFWWEPERAAKEECASCHDTGLIRTPYLTQVVDGSKRKVLPARRHTTAYWFPGDDFKDWNGKVFRIKDDAPVKNCTRCHPMGANTIDVDLGTSVWLGLMAAGKVDTDLLTPNGTWGQHASWMGKDAATAGHPLGPDKKDAVRMSKCALGTGTDCSYQLWDGQMAVLVANLVNRPLPSQAVPAPGRRPATRPLPPEP